MSILFVFPFLFGGQASAAFASQLAQKCDSAYAGMSSLEAQLAFYHHNIMRDELDGEPDFDKLSSYSFPTDESFAGTLTWSCDARGQFDLGFTPAPTEPGQKTSEVWGLRAKLVGSGSRNGMRAVRPRNSRPIASGRISIKRITSAFYTGASPISAWLRASS